MKERRISNLMHEGTYVAEVDVETIFTFQSGAKRRPNL